MASQQFAPKIHKVEYETARKNYKPELAFILTQAEEEDDRESNGKMRTQAELSTRYITFGPTTASSKLDHLRAMLPYKTSDFHALLGEQLPQADSSSDTEVEDFDGGKTADFDERAHDDGRSAALENQRASASSAKFAGSQNGQAGSPHQCQKVSSNYERSTNIGQLLRSSYSQLRKLQTPLRPIPRSPFSLQSHS